MLFNYYYCIKTCYPEGLPLKDAIELTVTLLR